MFNVDISAFRNKSDPETEGNDFLRYILKKSPAVAYLASPSGINRYRYISENITSLLGYQPEEMLEENFWLKNIHPEDKHCFLSDLHANLREGEGSLVYRIRAKDNTYRCILDQYRMLDSGGAPNELVGSLVDITGKQEIYQNCYADPIIDRLTGLLNRKGLQHHLDKLFEKDMSIQETTLSIINIDQFKVINTTYGYDAGDMLITELAGLIQASLDFQDTPARLHGDEFGILFESCSLQEAKEKLERIQEAIREYRLLWKGKKLGITASIGVVPLDNSTVIQEQLLGLVNTACYAAKDNGRNRIHIYQGEGDRILEKHKEMQFVEYINQAMEEDRFILFYQPIVPLKNDIREKHFELLIRMKDEDGKLVPPAFFLAAAEKYSLATKIDRWVIKTTLNWLEVYIDELDPNYSWGINLSGQSMMDDSLLQFVVEEIQYRKIPPQRIYFEVTETAAIENLENAIKFISVLKDLGCRFALDDFGSGVSSFAYLKKLPVDFIKIDGMFVKNLLDDDLNHVMVKAINDVSCAMNIQSIAEYVENRDIEEKLKEMNIGFAQGYGIGKPMPLSNFFQSGNIL